MACGLMQTCSSCNAFAYKPGSGRFADGVKASLLAPILEEQFIFLPPIGVDALQAPERAINVPNLHKKHIQTAEYQRTMQTGQVSLRNLSFFDRYQ